MRSPTGNTGGIVGVYWFVRIAFVFLLPVLLHASDRTLSDQSSPTIVFRSIAVSGELFDEQYVIQRCKEFLSQNEDKKVIVLTFVPDQRNATSSGLGCDHCKPYPFWMMQYRAIAKESFPIGELMALDGNAVLRYRSATGAVSETVLNGLDPRIVVLDNFQGRIVHLGMQGRMPKPWLMLYVVGTGMMNARTGADYVTTFSRQMGVEDSTVEFRSDPWFINEIWTIWFPLFEEHRVEAPSEADFNATRTVSCNVVLTPAKGSSHYCSWKDSVVLP